MNKKIKKIILWITVLIIGLPILLASATLINMYHGIYTGYSFQANHMDELKELYNRTDFIGVNEQDFCAFDLQDALNSGVKYNDLQYISSHNSYKQELSFFSKAVFNIFGSSFGMKEREFEYGFPTITEQLNNGIRYIDFDTGYLKRGGKWEIICSHDPILDNNSNALDFQLAIEEVYLWSQNNPNHLPLTIFIEPKSDFLYLPVLKEFGIEGMKEIDQIIKDTLGDTLFTPSDMLGDYANFKELTNDNGWAKLEDMLGKILFITYPDYNLEYMALDTTMSTQAMFMAVWHHSYERNLDSFAINTPFILTNHPDVEDSLGNSAIEKFLDLNLMVRTRLDFYPVIDTERKEKGIASNAQILSTDFLKDSRYEAQYYACFEGDYTIKLKQH